jgi:hypothetical protein
MYFWPPGGFVNFITNLLRRLIKIFKQPEATTERIHVDGGDYEAWVFPETVYFCTSVQPLYSITTSQKVCFEGRLTQAYHVLM